MALNFPDSPATNDYFTDNTSGFTYQWNGYVWISVGSTQSTTMKEFDDISGSFNGSTTTFELTFGSGTTKVYPFSANQITIILGGILQNAGDDFTISGNEITFTTAPDASLTFAGMFYGSSVSMNSAAAGSIGTAALTTGGPVWNTGGDVSVAGIVTVGSSSVVIDGPSNEIKVGTGATINESGITAGIITASAFYGDGSNLDGITAGIGTTGSANTTGIITASYFYGAGIGLTNIGGPIHAISYSPGIAATGIGASTNIVITFNKPLKANTGTITLKEGAADGSTIESFDVVSSSRITISGGQITIDPTSALSLSTSYYVAFPAGAYKDILDTASTVGISTYSFETEEQGYTDPFDGTFQLFTAGSGTDGALGKNNTAHYSSPSQIPGNSWRYATNQRNTALATKTDGTLWAWGSGSNGVTGQQDQVQRSSPRQIPGTYWDDIFLGGATSRFAMATKTDGTLWAWGSNNNGQLGQNNLTEYQSPVQIPGSQWKLAGVQESNEGNQTSYAFKTDGTLWAWGNNGNGNLGQNGTVNRSSPVQIPGTQWNIENGQSHLQRPFFATKTDGTLWVWGWAANGEHSLNDSGISRSSPTQIPGTQWKFVSGGQVNFGIKTDGTLWALGGNAGSGGNGTGNAIASVPVSSPIQIPGTQWETISGGNYFYAATKTDGTFWMWGNQSPGRFGLNNSGTVSYSSPIQVPGTQWAYGQVAEGSTFFLKNYS